MITFNFMKFKLFVVFFVATIALTVSCVSKEEQEQQATELAKQQFDSIDLSTPDSYPQFKGCDELQNAKDCFYENLYSHINTRLQSEPIDIQIAKVDTVNAVITVSNTGKVSYVALKDNNPTAYNSMIDSLLKARLSDLGSVHPAIKQGVPVGSSYLLPIIIKPRQ